MKLGDGALGRPPAPEPWGFLPAEPCLSVPTYTQCMAHHGEHDDKNPMVLEILEVNLDNGGILNAIEHILRIVYMV